MILSACAHGDLGSSVRRSQLAKSPSPEGDKGAGTQSTASKPNVIVILTDDQGYADVGFNGSQEIPTPHIDRIANEGVRFEEGYVTFPVCGPSRAGLITGRYQDRFGFGHNPTLDPSNARAGVPVHEETCFASAGT